jgi:hypothetical protein
MEITFEIYKRDGRRRDGRRLIKKIDFDYGDDDLSLCNMRDSLNQAWPLHKGYEIEEHETWVTRRNAMTGQKFQERYDRPFHCSPSSEAFFCS